MSFEIDEKEHERLKLAYPSQVLDIKLASGEEICLVNGFLFVVVHEWMKLGVNTTTT